MSLDNDLEKLATTAVSDWPEIAMSGQLDRASFTRRLDRPISPVSNNHNVLYRDMVV